jgi:hypothetical protein
MAKKANSYWDGEPEQERDDKEETTMARKPTTKKPAQKAKSTRKASTSKATKATKAPAAKKTTAKKELPECHCGCGQKVNSPKRTFRQGHDAKHKSALLKQAREGDKDAVKHLKEHGWDHLVNLNPKAKKATAKDAA